MWWWLSRSRATLISGAFRLLGGVVDAVVGVVLILALLALVAWMFAYAKKRQKK